MVIDILESKCVGLLDSGACRTVINSEFGSQLKVLGLKSHSTTDLKFNTADGTVHKIVEIFDVPVKFDNQFKVVSMLVVQSLSQRLILGKDFFDSFEIKMQFKNDNILSSNEINCVNSEDKSAIIVPRCDLDEEEQMKLSELIEEMEKTIGVGLGRTHLLKHSIDTGDSRPCFQKPYCFSPAIKKQLETELDDMLSKDVVEPSYSPWCSPVVLVKKPSGDNRLCLDSRQLNKLTKRDTYPLPRVTSIIDNLRSAKFLTTLDL